MIESGQVPTARMIQTRLRESINFRMGLTCLRKLLKEIVFYWMKCGSNRQMLMERSDVTVARLRYLRKIKEYREQGRNIVYTDETYLHTTHSVKKCWQSKDVQRHIPFTRGERFIKVYAVSRDVFVNGAALVFKSGQSTEDYHNDMNSKNFHKWVTERLMPNLPERSLLVVDNASYHNIQIDKCPTQATRKADITEWLNRLNIAHSEEMLKPELVELCKRNKPEPSYILDDLLKENGHDCIRLPPYHAELNAKELIWSQVKGRVAQCNTSFTATAVRQLIDDSLAKVTPEDWRKSCRHVQEREEEF